MAPLQFEIRPVLAAEYAHASSLLVRERLPASDLSPERVFLLGAFTLDAHLIGVIGLEPAGDDALVRSMVVSPAYRGQGVAKRLYAALVAEARRTSKRHVFVLTETAQKFFLALGFAEVARSSVPLAIQSTSQFSGLCPSTTSIFSRPL